MNLFSQSIVSDDDEEPKRIVYKGLVSVIIPTFNRADMLRRCLSDLKEQTYKNWEVIVVDDGSTDDTERAILDFDNGERNLIHISYSKNSGSVCIPRNIGISYSQGEFIAPFDDDCRHRPEKLEILVATLESNPSSVLAYGARLDHHIDGRTSVSAIPVWEPLQPEGWGVDNSQIIYRSKVYDDMGFVFCKRACDWELAKAVYPLGAFSYAPCIVSDYIWHGRNRSLDAETRIRELNIEPFKEYFCKNFPAKV